MSKRDPSIRQTPIDAAQAPPSLLRFSLRKMLLAIGLLAVFLAIATAVGPLVALCLVFVLAIILAHVASTFIGTKLRDSVTQTLSRDAWERDDFRQSASSDQEEGSQQAIETAMKGKLRQREQSFNRRRLTMIGVGAGAGGLAACMLVLILLVPTMTWIAAGVAALSGAVLGGWLSFGLAGFFGVSKSAWREAATSERDSTGDREQVLGGERIKRERRRLASDHVGQ